MPARAVPAEEFVRAILAEIAKARADGAMTPDAVAAALDARGITSRKGRRWTGRAVTKFLASPGARRRGAGIDPPVA